MAVMLKMILEIVMTGALVALIYAIMLFTNGVAPAPADMAFVVSVVALHRTFRLPR